MTLLLILAAVAVGLPALTHVLYLRENAQAGLLPRARELCGDRLCWPLLCAACNSCWSMALVALAFPLGWLPQGRTPTDRTGTLTPVILVHGLYHNASAWFWFRRRLRRAGFADVRSYAYVSFLRPFDSIVAGLAQAARQAADESPTGRVLLVGHSLGGLVIRSAGVRHGVYGRVAGILTLGTPHRGSNLAGLLAVGRLGRGIQPGGEVLEAVRRLPACPGPALSLYSPVDSLVLPLSGSLLEEREQRAGWTEACSHPVSHVGMLFDRRVAELGVEFLLRAASRPAAPEASS